MHILLVAPSSEEKIERSYLGPNLGIIRLAGFLNKHGHNAEYFDPSLKMATGNGPSLEEKLQERNWDIFGLSCLDDTLETDIKHMYLAKKYCPGSLLITGGIEAQFNYQTLLDKTPCSVVVLGEGEIPLLSIANGIPLHEIPGLVIKNTAKPLTQELFNEATYSIDWENVPYEDYWDYYVEKYDGLIDDQKDQEIHTVRVFSRNRCPIGCSFCSSTNQLTWGSESSVPVISTTEDNLISVIERIIKAHPRTKTIYLTDDDFCIDIRSVERFCEKVIDRDFQDLSFMCFARASDLKLELVKKMKAANFRRLIIGVESFSQPVLDDMNKRCSEKQIHDALNICHEAGIIPHINIILTTPYSNLEDIEKSIDNTLWYIEKGLVHCAVISAIRPLRGTDYFETHSKYETRIENIQGTRHKIKVNEYILSHDPIVQDIQKEYYFEIDNEVDKFAQFEKLKHKNTNAIAKVSLLYMKKLIGEARAAHGLAKYICELPDNKDRPLIDSVFQEYLQISNNWPKDLKTKLSAG